MSNFDLLEWCQYLKIPIKNVLSRDENVPHNQINGWVINKNIFYQNTEADIWGILRGF